MVDHLKEAKLYARSAESIGDAVETAQLNARLAIAHGIIALVERIDKAAEEAEAAAERAILLQEKEAQRAMQRWP